LSVSWRYCRGVSWCIGRCISRRVGWGLSWSVSRCVSWGCCRCISWSVGWGF